MSKLFSVNQAAERVGIKRKTLLQWIARGKVYPKPPMVGGAYVFTAAQVERLRSVSDNRKK
jgi:excisionase family DNA binding protein